MGWPLLSGSHAPRGHPPTPPPPREVFFQNPRPSPCLFQPHRLQWPLEGFGPRVCPVCSRPPTGTASPCDVTTVFPVSWLPGPSSAHRAGTGHWGGQGGVLTGGPRLLSVASSPQPFVWVKTGRRCACRVTLAVGASGCGCPPGRKGPWGVSPTTVEGCVPTPTVTWQEPSPWLWCYPSPSR